MRVDDCAVCTDESWTDDNLIVFCEGLRCNVAVHQKCYGIMKIPEDDIPWYCSVCSERQRCNAVCFLCGYEGGPMKRSVEGNWVHVFCARAFPETYFLEKDTLERVCGICYPRMDKRKQRCAICSKIIGYCIKCSVEDCQIWFHPTCQKDAGLPMETSIHAKPLLAFCDSHKDRAANSPDSYSVKHREHLRASHANKVVRAVHPNPKNAELWDVIVQSYFEDFKSLNMILRESQLDGLLLVNSYSKDTVDVCPLGKPFKEKWYDSENSSAYRQDIDEKEIHLPSLRGMINLEVRNRGYRQTLESFRTIQRSGIFAPYLVMRCRLDHDVSSMRVGFRHDEPNFYIEGVEPNIDEWDIYRGLRARDIPPHQSSYPTWIQDARLFTAGRLRITQNEEAFRKKNEDNEVTRDLRLLMLKLASLEKGLAVKLSKLKRSLPIDYIVEQMKRRRKLEEDQLLEKKFSLLYRACLVCHRFGCKHVLARRKHYVKNPNCSITELMNSDATIPLVICKDSRSKDKKDKKDSMNKVTRNEKSFKPKKASLFKRKLETNNSEKTQVGMTKKEGQQISVKKHKICPKSHSLGKKPRTSTSKKRALTITEIEQLRSQRRQQKSLEICARHSKHIYSISRASLLRKARDLLKRPYMLLQSPFEPDKFIVENLMEFMIMKVEDHFSPKPLLVSSFGLHMAQEAKRLGSKLKQSAANIVTEENLSSGKTLEKSLSNKHQAKRKINKQKQSPVKIIEKKIKKLSNKHSSGKFPSLDPKKIAKTTRVVKMVPKITKSPTRENIKFAPDSLKTYNSNQDANILKNSPVKDESKINNIP